MARRPRRARARRCSRPIAGLTPAGGAAGPSLAPGSSLDAPALDRIFDAQLDSRHLDHAARWLRSRGEGFYTIGSAGHEANALVAAALRPTDPALLHYRSGGFYLARAGQVDGPRRRRRRAARAAGLGRRADRRRAAQGLRPRRPGRHPADVDDRLAPAAGDGRGLRHRPGPPARADDALARRRHRRVQLRRRLAEPLDGAGRAQRGGVHRAPGRWPCRCCSCARTTGGGSACRRPSGWVEASLSARPGLRYEAADGTDPVDVFDVTEELADHVRRSGRPAVLHLRTVRFGGHAGTDVEAAYRTRGRHPRRPRRRSAAGHGPGARRRRVGDAGRDRRSLPRRPRARCGHGPSSWPAARA